MLVCSKCGEVMGDDIKFCPSCGTGTGTAVKVEDDIKNEPAVIEPVESSSEQGQQYQNTESASTGSKIEEDSKTSFFDAIKCFVTKIIDFKSETGKKEYWFGFLFYVIVCAACVILSDIAFIGWTFHFVQIAAALAFISMTIRRINNIKLPWYRIFFYLIPVYGQIRFFIEMLMPTV